MAPRGVRWGPMKRSPPSSSVRPVAPRREAVSPPRRHSSSVQRHCRQIRRGARGARRQRRGQAARRCPRGRRGTCRDRSRRAARRARAGASSAPAGRDRSGLAARQGNRHVPARRGSAPRDAEPRARAQHLPSSAAIRERRWSLCDRRAAVRGGIRGWRAAAARRAAPDRSAGGRAGPVVRTLPNQRPRGAEHVEFHSRCVARAGALCPGDHRSGRPAGGLDPLVCAMDRDRSGESTRRLDQSQDGALA